MINRKVDTAWEKLAEAKHLPKEIIVVLTMKVFAACVDFDSEKQPPACAFPCEDFHG